MLYRIKISFMRLFRYTFSVFSVVVLLLRHVNLNFLK